MFELRCYQRLFLESSQGEDFFLTCPGPSGICFKACLFTALCRWGFVLAGILCFAFVPAWLKTEKRPAGGIQRGVLRASREAFSLFDLFVRRVLALVAAILHKFQAMGGSALVFGRGVTRDARLAGLATSGALKMNDDTTLSGFFCHGVLQK